LVKNADHYIIFHPVNLMSTNPCWLLEILHATTVLTFQTTQVISSQRMRTSTSTPPLDPMEPVDRIKGEAFVKQKRENFFSKHQSSLLFVDGSKKFTKPMWFPKAPKAIDRWCSFNIRTQTKRDVDHYGRVKCLLFDSHLHSRSINLAVPKRKGRWVIITWNSTEACSSFGLVCHPNTIIQTWVSIISSVILDLARALLWNESRTFNVEHDTCGIVLGKNVFDSIHGRKKAVTSESLLSFW